uniref:Arginine decarboxylase n=1 Tax=Paulinella chromatophora TaxID=39717 RepID=B1X4D8_PAUCH|nr:arginine decarboxylase [Paulinella chromatophora]ACB42807.1 arginine decarboxylase [Paulinella chromatophora]
MVSQELITNNWTAADGAALYGLKQWGEPYFSVNACGHIVVQPNGSVQHSLDLVELVQGIQDRNLSLPLLIHFDDILEHRLNQLNNSFRKAIKKYDYAGCYQGVFPVKCNQQRHLLEHLVESGRSWNFGLEVGSKAELLIALSLLDNPKALLICNGYKDQRYIETAILARRLGRQPVIVIEQADELYRIVAASRILGASPLIGIRAKLSTRSTGRWGSSVGEMAKFGLAIPEIKTAVEKLREANLLNSLCLLHFHIGSQISDIAVLKDALQEAGQIYVQLVQLGAPMGYLDVGGGLGIDYDGSRTATAASTNYSLQNYANDVVATVKECCLSHSIKLPTIITESGRAIASHCSVLIFNVLGVGSVPAGIPAIADKEPLTVCNLRHTLANINCGNLQEMWNDALKFKEDALSAFRLGYLDLADRAKAEQLTWACAEHIAHLATHIGAADLPDDIRGLQSTLANTYYANLSVFRSAPDTWAIGQLFPILPIHRLNERPTQLGSFADLTCDSDGKLARFIDKGHVKSLLELHKYKEGEPYWIGLFLGGAYQEVMGNLHNLFGTTNSVHIRLGKDGNYKVDHVVKGNTNAEVLKAMEHDPELLLERLRIASEVAISQGKLIVADAQKLMNHLETSLSQITYHLQG